MRRGIRVFLIVAAVSGLVGAWAAFAPAALPGGSASYVVPSGSSMLPSLGEGDLAIVRGASSYAVDDVVAYRSSRLGQTVLHRIVELEGGRFVLKGDNNTWRDADRPSREDVIGKLWIRVPGGGAVLEWARTPLNAAILAGGSALLLTGGVLGTRRRRRRRRHDATQRAPSRTAARSASGGQAVARLAAVALAVAALAFGGLAAAAFARPGTQRIAADVEYRQTGTFAYSADVERGAVYPDGKASTGDPLFLRLATSMSVRFDYRLESAAPHAVSGSVYLVATLADDTGWRRTVMVGPPVDFTGGGASVTAELDLAEMAGLMRRVEKATGVMAGYSLALQAVVETGGTVAGRPIDASFSPELDFEVDQLVLRVAPPDDPEMEVRDLLEHSAEDSVRTRIETPNVLSLGPLTLDVERARLIAAIAGAVSLLGLLVTAVLLLIGRRRDEASRIRARYGPRMIDVAAGGGSHRLQLVELDSIESLVRLADSYERMILHEKADSAHHYLVEGDVSTYRYSAAP